MSEGSSLNGLQISKSNTEEKQKATVDDIAAVHIQSIARGGDYWSDNGQQPNALEFVQQLWQEVLMWPWEHAVEEQERFFEQTKTQRQAQQSVKGKL